MTEQAIRPDSARTVAARLVHWLDQLAPREERFVHLSESLTQAFEHDSEPVSDDTLRRMESIIHPWCRHLTLDFAARGDLTVTESSSGWPAVSAADVAQRGAWISAVSRTTDNIALLRVDNLDPLAHATPFFEAAFALMRGARGLILDLRGNGGGDPGTLALIVSYLVGAASVPISEVTYRDRSRQWWTTERSEQSSFGRDGKVAVLIGPRTYSSGEALAYHLQTIGVGPLVGEPTPGAADHVTPIALTRHVHALIPEGTVVDSRTNGNWEGRGVQPDIVADGDNAVEVALGHVRGAT